MTGTHGIAYTDVFPQVAAIIREVLELAEDEIDISPEMTLTEDLGLESIDLVTIGATLAERFGERVNLADHLADMEMDEVIALNVESIVQLVRSALGAEAEVDA